MRKARRRTPPAAGGLPWASHCCTAMANFVKQKTVRHVQVPKSNFMLRRFFSAAEGLANLTCTMHCPACIATADSESLYQWHVRAPEHSSGHLNSAKPSTTPTSPVLLAGRYALRRAAKALYAATGLQKNTRNKQARPAHLVGIKCCCRSTTVATERASNTTPMADPQALISSITSAVTSHTTTPPVEFCSSPEYLHRVSVLYTSSQCCLRVPLPETCGVSRMFLPAAHGDYN